MVDLLNVKQVSNILNVSTKTVRKLLRDKVVASVRVGREFRVSKKTLMEYLESDI